MQDETMAPDGWGKIENEFELTSFPESSVPESMILKKWGPASLWRRQRPWQAMQQRHWMLKEEEGGGGGRGRRWWGRRWWFWVSTGACQSGCAAFVLDWSKSLRGFVRMIIYGRVARWRVEIRNEHTCGFASYSCMKWQFCSSIHLLFLILLIQYPMFHLIMHGRTNLMYRIKGNGDSRMVLGIRISDWKHHSIVLKIKYVSSHSIPNSIPFQFGFYPQNMSMYFVYILIVFFHVLLRLPYPS